MYSRIKMSRFCAKNTFFQECLNLYCHLSNNYQLVVIELNEIYHYRTIRNKQYGGYEGARRI